MNGFAPKKERESVLLMARIEAPAGRAPSDHRVRNLSREGTCIEYPGRLEKHEQLRVSIGLVEGVAAEVAWARGGFAGLKFLHPIDAQAARKKRVSKATEARAGWMVDVRHAHRRLG